VEPKLSGFPDSKEFGPIWYASHDAPVILYQSADLGEFLFELFKMCQPPYKSLVDDVHEDRIRDVWNTNPGVLEHKTCTESPDKVLTSVIYVTRYEISSVSRTVIASAIDAVIDVGYSSVPINSDMAPADVNSPVTCKSDAMRVPAAYSDW